MRILIVEDDAALLESLAEVLASFGYAVATARDGDEALSKVASSDVLLTDVVLPRLSGIDLARRAREAHRELELIVMTGHHMPAIREEAELAGARAYFQKPFDVQELLAVLRAVELERSWGSRSVAERRQGNPVPSVSSATADRGCRQSATPTTQEDRDASESDRRPPATVLRGTNP